MQKCCCCRTGSEPIRITSGLNSKPCASMGSWRFRRHESRRHLFFLHSVSLCIHACRSLHYLKRSVSRVGGREKDLRVCRDFEGDTVHVEHEIQ